jgi:hypothetical protein
MKCFEVAHSKTYKLCADLFVTDFFSQSEGHKQRNIIFNTPTVTLHEDLHIFYFCQWHKLTITAMLYNTQYFLKVDSDM